MALVGLHTPHKAAVRDRQQQIPFFLPSLFRVQRIGNSCLSGNQTRQKIRVMTLCNLFLSEGEGKCLVKGKGRERRKTLSTNHVYSLLHRLLL